MFVTLLHLITLAMLFIATMEKVSNVFPPIYSTYHHPMFSLILIKCTIIKGFSSFSFNVSMNHPPPPPYYLLLDKD